MLKWIKKLPMCQCQTVCLARAGGASFLKKLFAIMLGLMLIAPSLSTAATINFRDVEIRQFIESMSELTGRNFLMDSRVRGKTTIIANSEVPDDALYDIMLTVLAMQGFRAVDVANGLTSIVPANLAPRYSPLDVESSLQTEIIPVRHLDVGAVIPIIRPLMTGEAQVVPFKRLNSLIVTELKTNIERIKEIIKAVDRKSLDDYEIIELKHLKADDIARIIEKARNPAIKQLAKIVTDQKNDRIILTGEPQDRLPLRALIAELDTRPTTSDQRGVVRVIPLNYANADDMKSILKGLLTKQFLELASEGDIMDDRQTPKAAEKTDDKKDDDKKEDDKKDEKRSETLSGSGYTVQSDPDTNVLIVSGAANLVQAITDVVERLDVPRPQVLIEAIIAELSLNRSANVSTRLSGVKDSADLPGGGASPRNRNPVTSLRGLFAAFNLTTDNPSFSVFAGGRSGDLNLGLFIQALNTDRNTNILATPSVMTLNNEKATIKVGEERSIDAGAVSAEGTVRQNIERLDVDTELEVTPQITKGDAVSLKIKQKVKRVASGGNTARPVTSDREIQTHVVVDDGKIVVLGGLVEERREDAKNRVPLLSNIPVLGNLFKGRDSNNDKTNLMVFIRPTIFRTTESAHQEASNRYVQLRLEQLKHLKRTDTLLDDDTETMLLPRLELDRKTPTATKRPPSSPTPRSSPSPSSRSRTSDGRT